MAEQKHVVFRLGAELYAVPISEVERILTEQQLTRVARSPKMLLGIFDLRGEPVCVMDMRLRLEMPTREDAGNLVVVASPWGRVALRVDSVEGIWSFDQEGIDEKPAFLHDSRDPFVAGIGKHGAILVVMLDPAHLVPEAIAAKLKKQSAA